MSPLTVPPIRVRGTPHLAVFLALVAGISLLAYRSYVEQEKVFRAGLHEQLQDIAALKFGQADDWQLERRGDVIVTARAASLMPGLERALGSHPDADYVVQATHWLDQVRKNYRYSGVALLDASGAVRIHAGEMLVSPEFYRSLPMQEMTRLEMTFDYNPQGPQIPKSHFMLMSRLHSAPSDGNPTGRVFGYIVLTADPWVAPLPEVLKWVSPTASGRIFVVLNEGKNVRVFGYESGNKPSEIVIPQSDKQSVFIRATSSPVGIVDGADTSGKRFAAAGVSKKVGGRNLTLVSMMDESEAYKPLRQTTILVTLAAGLLIVISGAGVGWIWRQQVLGAYRQQVDAEQAHRALIGHYDFLTRYANDAIFLAAPNGEIVQVNERASDYFGYSRDELLRMRVQQLRGANTEEDYRRAQEALDEKKNIVFETVGIRKDGIAIPVELSIRMIDVEGTEYRQTIVRNITERRRAEEQIGRLNRLYVVLSRCGQAIVNALGEATLFQEICKVTVESGGFRLAAIRVVNQDTGRLIPAARAGEASAYLNDVSDEFPVAGTPGKLLREGGAFVSNDLWQDPSMANLREEAVKHNLRSLLLLPLWRGGRMVGEMRLYSSEPGFFNEGETKLATEIAESINFALESLERKKKQQNIELELRSSRERLEMVLDATEEVYWDWDLETDGALLSPRYDSMLGYGPNEVPRGYQAWLSMIHPEDSERVAEEYRSILESGQDVLVNEFRMRSKSGEYISIFNRGKVVTRNESGKARRMVGTFTDVTDRKKLEEQFRQAQKLESVGRLAGGVAHDFNNLLTVINGYSGLMLARLPGKDPNRPQLEEIRKAGQRAEELTRQLLTFSRKQVTELRLLNLNEAVRDSEKLLHRLIPASVEFRLHLNATSDGVVTDPGQIHQILMNLVVNACDAMPGGGILIAHTENIEVDAGTLREPDITSGPFVLLSVSDTGTGMDEEILQHIFEPFFTTKDPGKGTGLGLSTVYGIVRQCHGFMRVESKPGTGTTFKLHFPVAGDSLRPHPAAKPVDQDLLHGNETILVVEDQESVRNLAVETLRMYGYPVLAAASGAAALAIARQHAGPIHLLLTDVIMPEMNGRELAHQIRELRPATKVLYMSGYSHDVVSDAHELGPETSYLQKPFAPEELAGKVRESLKQTVAARTILVVDDEYAVRKIMAEFLGRKHTVLLAGDGAEALRRIEEDGNIDVVVTDLVMPNQEGIDMIRTLRKRRPGVKIIAMSGAFGGQFLKTAELLGADATLAKPVRPEVLEQLIEEVLGRAVR